jgi:hypothetical protein
MLSLQTGNPANKPSEPKNAFPHLILTSKLSPLGCSIPAIKFDIHTLKLTASRKHTLQIYQIFDSNGLASTFLLNFGTVLT